MHVLHSPELMRHIFSYQPGLLLDLRPIFPLTKMPRSSVALHHLLSYPDSTAPNSFRAISADLALMDVVLGPWYIEHGITCMEHLFDWNESLVPVLLLHGIFTGNIDVVQSIIDEFELAPYHSRFSLPLDSLGDIAAANNQLPMLQFLLSLDGIGGPCSHSALNKASQNGHLAMVQHLHTELHATCTTAAMDSAARNGHLDIVRYLHAYRQEGCTNLAMHLAAIHGHVAVVEFLHTRRQEGCLGPMTMDMAAGEGHMDVVLFLHTHRTEGCTSTALDTAAANGHLDVVRFLHVNRTEGCTAAALAGAMVNQHFEVAAYLQTHMGRQGENDRTTDGDEPTTATTSAPTTVIR
ncbi:Aste57867_23635 [Aphanomyces stellatus]|uniref:Aste57867_23635 protein n=1 Tax=Aphanomyces stellatus TaxID=120398 RepID=A0A485LNE6_9STRA|nr:hypothetical protein As57867_023563 [Aphanomyces stellatus]VFU00280.1 Aste57867_23635 [Aphanomyces stellatus]